ETHADLTLRRTLQLRLVGSTLVLQLSAAESSPVSANAPAGRPRRGRGKARKADAPPAAAALGYSGFSFGTLADARAREPLLPYPSPPPLLLRNGWFAPAYVDRFQSAANACPRGTAFYRADTLGNVGAIAETLYVTGAADPLDTLPLLDAPASPYREELARRV